MNKTVFNDIFKTDATFKRIAGSSETRQINLLFCYSAGTRRRHVPAFQNSIT